MLKESIKEDKKFCKELVDQCQYVHLLIDLCSQRREEHGLILDWYEVSIEEELVKAYFQVETLCSRIREKYGQP
jgi:hypothetical protein